MKTLNVEILEVRNGFIVRPSYLGRDNYAISINDAWVASDFESLCELLRSMTDSGLPLQTSEIKSPKNDTK